MSTRTRSRLLMALAALVMLPVFVSPLWTIGLVAPQYSDGLGMYIYVNDIVGHERHDIQNINILNHYIGMQEIDPETVPALEIMPIVLAGLVITGLLVAVIGKPWLMVGWLGAFLVAGVAGMVEFYAWNIDYGHNLSPDAPIRIPDMTYSPPIIGTEQLLNIRASSWPHLGSLYLAISALLAAAAAFVGFRGRRREKGEAQGGDAAPKPASLAAAFVVLLFVAGCGSAEEPRLDSAGEAPGDRIVYGVDEDPFCGDTVEAVRWGGEIVTPAGERLRFRSVECLAGYLLEGRLDPDEALQVRVVDFPHGWKLVDASEARFLHTPNLSSPDGSRLLAIEAPQMQRNLQDAYTGPLLTWEEVLELVREERTPGETRS